MATTTINIAITVDSANVDDFVDTIAAYLGYQEMITNPDGTTSPNPTTTLEFDHQAVIKYLSDCFAAGKTQLALQQAQQSTQTTLDQLASAFTSEVSTS